MNYTVSFRLFIIRSFFFGVISWSFFFITVVFTFLLLRVNVVAVPCQVVIISLFSILLLLLFRALFITLTCALRLLWAFLIALSSAALFFRALFVAFSARRLLRALLITLTAATLSLFTFALFSDGFKGLAILSEFGRVVTFIAFSLKAFT